MRAALRGRMLTEGKTIGPSYVTHEHKRTGFVAEIADTAEREIVLMPVGHFHLAKNSLF
jgi:hypothetical protein